MYISRRFAITSGGACFLSPNVHNAVYGAMVRLMLAGLDLSDELRRPGSVLMSYTNEGSHK